MCGTEEGRRTMRKKLLFVGTILCAALAFAGAANAGCAVIPLLLCLACSGAYRGLNRGRGKKPEQ